MPIVIIFIPDSLGRVVFPIGVLKNDSLSHGQVAFKLDTGSDFTTISCGDLHKLGYTDEFLAQCPKYTLPEGEQVSTAIGGAVTLRYLTDVTIKFGEREIQGCRMFFALGTEMRSLFGSDILKYFNWEVNYDEGELRLNKRTEAPSLSAGEKRLHIYSLDTPGGSSYT